MTLRMHRLSLSPCLRLSLALFLLLSLAGCAVERSKVYVKDGKQYGVTPGLTWRGRWWNYYQRGTSYAEGEFWEAAMADFQAAMQQREADQRQARTYGLHFTDYFPHRELGIAYYHLGRHADAVRELEASLRTVDSARAKFYLNKARQMQLQQTGLDTAPPRIVLDRPTDGLLTNQLTITVTGRAEDDTYVSAVAINGQALFIELAEPRIPFTQDITLRDGPNAIDIVAADLLGRLTRQRLTVHVDRRGPLVSLEGVDMLGTPPMRRVRVTGFIADQSPLRRFLLAGRQVPVPPETEWEFREEVLLTTDMEALPFEVEDTAGNVTRGEIALSPTASGPPGVREGQLTTPPPLRWAALAPGTVVADLPAWQVTQRQPGPRPDREPPVIRLATLAAQQTVYYDTVYLEGKVTDASPITAFAINGESFWRRKSTQLFFGVLLPLRVGENRFLLESADELGNTARHEVVVTHQVQEVRRLEARLRVAIMPAVKKGDTSALGETVDDHLLTALVQQGRFQLVERQQLEAILREQRISVTELIDPATAVRIGKIAAAEGVMIGTVAQTPQALEVFARFVDAETGVVMVAEDVYGEHLTLRDVQTLMHGLAWKFQQRFPLVEGSVVKREGTRIVVDRGSKHALQKHMKAILFRDGEVLIHPVTGKPLGQPTETLGEVRVEAVFEEFSQATLLQSEQAANVQQLDKVITK